MAIRQELDRRSAKFRNRVSDPNPSEIQLAECPTKPPGDIDDSSGQIAAMRLHSNTCAN
jgi:hypothetical protein